MRLQWADQRTLAIIGTGAVLVLAALAVVAGLWVQGLRRADQYPGASVLSQHISYKVGSTLHIRQESTYHSRDSFVDLYGWYSIGFRLGPEVRGQSTCNMMEKSSTWMVFVRSMTVTLCDTPTGRLAFVMRSFTVRPNN